MEAILLLREHSHRAWSVPQLAERLYVSEAEARETLQDLVASGLVGTAEGQYRYVQADPEASAALDDLANCYRTRLIALTKLIHSRPKKSNIHLFADVFRFRKEG